MDPAVAENDEVSDQAEVITFLRDASSYAGLVQSVEVIETHAAMVFLTENEAFKIKKAVTFPYLDFGTVKKRKAACEHELRINQPHAPQIYLDVIVITREASGDLALGGAGKPVEWVLHMRRFPDNSLLGDVIRTDGVSADYLDRLADEIGRYQGEARVVRDDCAAGRMTAIVDELCDAFDEAAEFLPLAEIRRFEQSANAALRQSSALLDERGRLGYVRRCHGDLHLSNIIVLNGEPVLFDAIEFNDEIATVDVLYDLAFLLMDLGHLGEDGHANRILNRYLSLSGNADHLAGLQALPLFMACRAGVRAMVAVTRLQQSSRTGRPSETAVDASSYLCEATGYLASRKPRLIAVGGLSGTGKTSLARALAARIVPSPGAVHLRTDIERKQLFDVAETTRLPKETYTQEASDAVYGRVLHKAAIALRAGHTVIVDAVFLHQTERSAIEQVAEEAGASFAGLWLEAAEEHLVARVTARQGDASDATADVVRHQLRHRAGPVNWHRINADGVLEETMEQSLKVL
ncbi:AAA family ATPase [Anderseniella sp. Alg231-50]|uniref:AAA family ATPase n=1 Tax=Anderseniella sp. Alg231-50 TaxID=1922226 RepID=UPI000D55AD36